MLNMNNERDYLKMKDYYRTSDMLNLLYFFPELSPIRDITIVENEQDIKDNKEYLESFAYNRIDNIKGRNSNLKIENAGKYVSVSETLSKIKEQDPNGVLVLFNSIGNPSERYERFAGISVGVDLGKDVIIDAVSKGFDGREVSKCICTHERYYIPWFDLRKICIGNFKDYQDYQINANDYQQSRLERIEFLKSVGLNPEIFSKYIPEEYQKIPDYIWLSVIENLIKRLEKNEEFLEKYDFTNFAISGHTEGNKFAPWQMFDKSRYTLVRKK